MVHNIQYPAAKVVLRNPMDSKILLLSREIDGSVGYEPAGGKVDANFAERTSESYEDCAIREIQEELGIEIKITDYVGSYYFFWSLKPNACSHCVLFLADIVSGQVKSVQQDKCGSLSAVWVSVEDIREKKIPIRDYHVGLGSLLIKAAELISISA